MNAAQKIGPYEVHPAAQVFPMMEEERLQQLADSIKAKGQEEMIALLDGKILDGRNRYLACERAGVSPWMGPWHPEPGSGDTPVDYVLRKNFHRRDLTPSQRAAIAADVQLLVEEERALERKREGGRKGGSAKDSAPGREASAADQEGAVTESPAGEDAGQQSEEGTGPPPLVPSSSLKEDVEDWVDRQALAVPLQPKKKGKAAEKVAAIAGVGARTVERAKAVKQRSPELFEKVKAGEVTLKRAEKDLRKEERRAEAKAYVPPEGQFAVIAADVPWQYDDELDGSDAVRGGLPYPPMPIEEICAFGAKVPAAKDCILWFWVTNTHLINGNAARVLEAWGFTPKALYTWDKEDMITGHWGRGVTEHVILAVKGHPVGEFERQKNLFHEKRSRKHSRKPEAFYRIVEKTCPSTSRLEMFSTQKRKGWVTSGSELKGEGSPAQRGAGPTKAGAGSEQPAPAPSSKAEGPAHQWERQNPLSAPVRALYQCLLCDLKHRGQETPVPYGPCRPKEISLPAAAPTAKPAGEVIWWLVSAKPGDTMSHAYPGQDLEAYTGPEVSGAKLALCGEKRPKKERPGDRGDQGCEKCDHLVGERRAAAAQAALNAPTEHYLRATGGRTPKKTTVDALVEPAACLCGCARARHRFRPGEGQLPGGGCRDCTCELYEPAGTEYTAPPAAPTHWTWMRAETHQARHAHAVDSKTHNRLAACGEKLPVASRRARDNEKRCEGCLVSIQFAPPTPATPWTVEWRRKGKAGLAHAYGDPALKGRSSCGRPAEKRPNVVKAARPGEQFCPDCQDGVGAQVDAGRAVDPIRVEPIAGPYAAEQACSVCGCTESNACPPDGGGVSCWWIHKKGEAPLCSRCEGKSTPAGDRKGLQRPPGWTWREVNIHPSVRRAHAMAWPGEISTLCGAELSSGKPAQSDRAPCEYCLEEIARPTGPYTLLATEAHRRGEDICPGCGVTRKENNPENGGVGWQHGSVGDQPALPQCRTCVSKGIPRVPVSAEDQAAWNRALRRRAKKSVRGKRRRGQARSTTKDTAPAFREVAIKAGSFRDGRGGGQCQALSQRGWPEDPTRCASKAKAVVKAKSGRLFSVCPRHGQAAMRDRTLRIATEG